MIQPLAQGSRDIVHTVGTLFTPDNQRADTRQWRKCRPLLAFDQCPARDSNPEPTDLRVLRHF